MIDKKRARRIKLVGFDVDGVMTDAGVYMGMSGNTQVELKRFDIQDGIGVRLLRETAIRVVIVSGRISRATILRAEELGVTEVVQDDQARKLEAFEELLVRYNVRWADRFSAASPLTPSIPHSLNP